ncbi:hypothetical protein BO99DRAFT_436532 [Aspergillus violaceofuscus CBS 115571]|uniref:Aminoglycoside phosphotransferase domain-containing protein n=1 Tax=Aspergillus violaceofuscus (strain CBS 115571) TaxID=1450538 RepID=A0A2V5GV94_ASPV1|nr:hypothetical protein BO99DRAFT_436532 [Aspergillus violaceofuscus CBS 115571]
MKLAEGGYNKVFRFIMNDGKTVLARIPNPNAGPAFYTTASEVATMELARDFLQIPVPRVLDWSATSNNAVGSEYIIMEEASGIQLGVIWDQLNPDKKLSIMRQILTLESKMLGVSFSHFGSIYFASDPVESAVPALLTNGASSELKERVCKKFSIGPTVERSFWKKERSSMQISRGRTPQEYALSVGRRELEWIKRFAISKLPSEATLISSAPQNSPQAHLQLLEKYLQVAPAMMNIDSVLTRPTLWHGDLLSSNLFVDDGQITAVIDCILLQRPGNFDDLGPEQQAEIKHKIFKSTLYQLYLLETKERNPLMTSSLPNLIFHLRHWPELGIQGECPYHFTQDEPHSHPADAGGWNEVQGFFDGIEGLVKRDGWTSPDTFDAAFSFFSELRERGLRRALDRPTRWARKQNG